MKVEVARSIARGKRHRWRIVGREDAARGVEPPDEDRIETQIDVEDEPSRRIRLDHVRMRAIVPARREAALRRVRGLPGTDGAGIDFDVARFAQPPVWQN